VTAPGGVIATVYVEVLPKIQNFAKQLRQDLRQSSRELRQIDRELTPVARGFENVGKIATGIIPGLKLTRTSLLALGSQAVVGSIISAAGAATTLSGALGVLPAAGVAAASVMGALTIGLDGVSDALEKFRDPEKFAAKLKLLSQNAQDTLGVLNEFRTEIFGFRDAVQDQLFSGLDDVARSLVTTFLPRATTHFTNLASVINLGAKDLANFVQTGATLADVDEVTGNVELGFSSLRAALIPAATAFRDIITVGSRFLPLIASEITRVVTQFSNWIEVMRATGQLQAFFQSGIQALEQIFRILGNVGSAIRGVLGAAKESGNGLLDTLESLTDKIDKFVNSARGQNQIKSFLDDARSAAEALAPVMVALADLLFNHVFPVLESFAKSVGPAVAQFFSALGDALDDAAPGIEVFAAGFALFIKGITPVLPLIGQLVGQFATLVGVIAGKLGPVIAEVATAIGNILLPILNILSAIFIVLSPDVLKFAVVIGVVVVAITGLINIVRGAEALIGLFSGGIEKLAKGFSKTQGAATGLSGFLGGPWGIALGIGLTVLGLFLSTTDGAAQKQAELKNAAAQLNDVIREQNGVINENVRLKASQQLEEQGALNLAKQLGISLGDVTNAYLGQGDSLDKLRDRLKGIIDASTEQNAAMDETAAIAGSSSDGQVEAARQLLAILDQLSGARDADTEATNREAQAAFGAINPMTAWQAIIQGTTDAYNQLLAVQQRSQQQQVEALNSEIGYFNQLERTRVELDTGTKTLDIHTQAGRDNLATITQLVTAGAKRVQDLQAQHASSETIVAVTQQMQTELLDMLQPFFSSREAARQYAVQLGLIPDSITTNLILNVNTAVAAAQAAASRIRDITLGFLGRASGGPVPAGQWTWVGEKGPELVRFGRSARVFSADESENMSRDVGQLDMMTSRGSISGVAPQPTTGTQPVQVSNQVSVEPTVKVYIDGQEFRGLVRVEMNERDRQLQRLVTTNVGGRR
jgi:phage-related protein